jgi:hypothetical protein
MYVRINIGKSYIVYMVDLYFLALLISKSKNIFLLSTFVYFIYAYIIIILSIKIGVLPFGLVMLIFFFYFLD